MKEKTPLFTELSSEESAAVSGGRRVSFDLNTYLFILGAGVLFGNPGLTADEIQFAWMSSFVFDDAPANSTNSNVNPISFIISKNSRKSRTIYF